VRYRTVAALLAVCLLAACGGRLSEDEIAAQLSADGGGGGIGPGARTNAGTGDVAGGDGLVGGEDAGGAGGASGSGGGAGGGAAGGGGAGGGQAPGAPPGGNGGATDVGVTATEVKLGNVSTLGGPVPGLFRGALVGTQAYFAYQNSLGGLFGRKFSVLSADDNFDSGANRSKVKELQDKVFSFVGSFSLFDGAGAIEMKSSGVLDVGRALSPERAALPNSYSPAPFEIGWPRTGCKWLAGRFPKDVIEKAAFFIGAADAARNNANWQRKACEAEGFKFVYTREVQPTESNFTGDVIQMRQRDVKAVFVVFDVTGIARLFKSLHQQNFNPPLKYPSAAAYDGDFIGLVGADAAEGILIGQSFAMFLGEDQGQFPEIGRFREWMKRVAPSQKVDLFAMYGWLSGKLFIEAMQKVGPKITRTAMIEALKGVHEFSGGMQTPTDVGAKKNPVCEMYMQVKAGKFTRVDPPTGFSCGTFQPY
jgi:ABC-type branched-subunit amino acid transport system substrate-binding protein